MSKLLELAHKRLGWPPEKDIINPKGTGPSVIAELAKRKIETAIRRERIDVNVGVLAANPLSNRTEDPLAIVCDFAAKINDEILRETYRLAWSFSRSPMLITVEPSLLKVWTCWKRPEELDKHFDKLCVEKVERNLFTDVSLSAQAAKTLQWVELASGNFFRNPQYSKYFHRDQRADQLMLGDLKVLRQKLLAAELPEDICHDLIARVIFIEFLFQRKDSQGYAALNEKILAGMHEKGVLKKQHKDLADILTDHGDTYRFFRELNGRFNGDLFPSKGDTPQEREKEWKQEMQSVHEKTHLRLLADFTSGKMEIATGQQCLWRRYAFDAIPLEFISSIYEEFVSGKKKAKEKRKAKTVGVHYTPSHVVDFMLDEALPWDGNEWDLKICDPACGSGIFLVKAFQRLIYRWRKGHPTKKPSTEDLRKLLKNNLFGVDIDPHAVRVASFSLYLAMCDELEPRYYWQNVKFPPLREERLVTSDFFAEDKEGFKTEKDANTYDLVVGNAPWGYGSETDDGKRWASLRVWKIPNRNLGPLFLCKAGRLTKPSGIIIMLQPAGAMLFNRQSTAKMFREKFFSTFKIETIINLAPLRFGLFNLAISPACIFKMRPIHPSDEPIAYICPKPRHTKEDDYGILVEPIDVSYVYPEEAVKDRLVWTVLAWGGRRDLQLIRKLQEVSFPKLGELEKRGIIRIGNGFKRGILRASEHPETYKLPILDSHELWNKLNIVSKASEFPVNENLMFERLRELEENYTLPLLLLKQSWTAEAKRFKAVLVEPTSGTTENKLLFSESFNGIQGTKMDGYDITNIAFIINSILSVYYFMLTGARMGSYRPTVLLLDIRDFPLPARMKTSPKKLARMNECDIDEEVRDAYGLNNSEWVLVEDLFKYTLRDFKEGMNSPGRQNTRDEEREGTLEAYCQYFIRVLEAGFGKERKVSATIFTEGNESQLPVRLVAIHLDSPEKPFIRAENIDSQELIRRLQMLDAKYLKSANGRTRGGIFYQRVARVYDTVTIDGKKVPTVFIIKPDQIRYWTQSMAMRDADEIAGDIMLWQDSSEGIHERGGK